jgi:hypothetical protein
MMKRADDYQDSCFTTPAIAGVFVCGPPQIHGQETVIRVADKGGTASGFEAFSASAGYRLSKL